MGDDLKPLPTDASPPMISHNSILIWMAVVIAMGSIAGFAFASVGFGVGVLVGGVLAFANYFWQRNSTRAIFAGAAQGEMPVLPAVRYILRYVVIAAVLWVIYMTNALPIVAVVLGLAAFAFAVVVEGLKGIFTSHNKQGS